MVGWVELATIAFVAQLAVLPGEKVQFIIAGLSTRYNPLVVVAAAGTAFAGWTVLELLFGQAIQGVFPGWVLDTITAVLFLLFAAMLYRSAPAPGVDAFEAATDGGIASLEDVGTADAEILGWEVPDALGGFVPIFAMMAAGEFGDKTQLVTIGLAVQYGAHPAIWAGEMAAIIPVSLANALLFHKFSHRFDVRKAHFAGAALFLFFGLDTVLALTTGFSVWEFLVGELAAMLGAVVPV